MYSGNGYAQSFGTTGITTIEAYESFLGREVDYVLDFLVDAPTAWSQFEQGCVAPYTTPQSRVSIWSGNLGTRQLVLGIPACCMGTTWATEASGANDSHWTALGNYLVAQGFADATLRIGREFNGDWYPWSVTSSGNNDLASYIHAYQHLVTLLRGISGSSFTFCWNPYIGLPEGSGLTDTTHANPGSSYVDQVGLDIYDGDWTGTYGHGYAPSQSAQETVWSGYLTGACGGATDINNLDSWRHWANDLLVPNKPVVFPEWGLRLWQDGPKAQYHGGGDNPYFVNQMAAWITETNASWHAFWEDACVGVSDPENFSRHDGSYGRIVAVPNSRRTFLDQFGT